MIELAIAITLAGMVTAGLYQLFSVQSRQLLFLDLQTEMHQNLRFATDVLTRTIREAGMGVGSGTTGYLGASGDTNQVLPVVTSYNDWTGGDGTDAFTLVHMDPSLTMNTAAPLGAPPGCDTEELSFNLNVPDYATVIQSFESGEFLLCYDFTNFTDEESYLWVISSVDTTNGTIAVADNCSYTDYLNICACGTENLTPVMTCSKAEVITFYIDNDADGTGPGSEEHPVLMMDLDLDWPESDDVPLVDDIEDVQVAYCLRDNDCSDPTAWVNSITSTQTVWMMRVSIIARSTREDPRGKYEGLRPALESHSEASASDHYYRQVLTTEVTLRNQRFYSNMYSP